MHGHARLQNVALFGAALYVTLEGALKVLEPDWKANPSSRRELKEAQSLRDTDKSQENASGSIIAIASILEIIKSPDSFADHFLICCTNRAVHLSIP